MANPAVGFKGIARFGRESTWGTAVTVTHQYPFLGSSFTADGGRVANRSITGSVNTSPGIMTLEKCVGYIEVYCDFLTQLLLLDGIFGTSTYGANGGGTSGAGPYTHTFNDSKLFFNSYTIELIEGGTPANQCVLITGAKIKSATWRWAAEQGDSAIGVLRLEIVGKRKQYGQTPSASLTASTTSPIIWRHITTANNGTGDAAGDQKITAFELTIENPLTEAWTGASGQYIDEPILNGQRTAMLKWTQRRHSNAIEAAYLAATQFTAVSFAFTNTHTYTLTFPKVTITTPADADENAYGLLMQEVSAEAHDGGSYATQLVVVNTKATITTP